MKQSLLNYFIYARKSSEDKDRQLLSIPAQLEEADRVVQSRGLFVAGAPFTEERSAKAVGRPAFNAMLERVERGDANAIICWKLDRLARNPIDGGRIMDLLQRGVLQEIRTPTSRYTPETNVIVLAVEFGMANQFIRDLSSNVRRGQRRKASLGIPHGLAPIGYKNDKSGEKGAKRWQVDAERFPIIEEVFRRILCGRYSVREVWEHACNELGLRTPIRKRSGGKPVTLSNFYKLLANSYYAGFFFYEGKRYEMDQALPRAITEDEYWHVQKMLGRLGRQRHSARPRAIYTGFIRCAQYDCGVVADFKDHVVCSGCRYKFSYATRSNCPKCGTAISHMKSPTFRHYVYYRSSRARKMIGVRAPAIEERKVEAFLLDYIKQNLAISTALRDWILKHLSHLRDEELEASRSVDNCRLDAIADLKSQRREVVIMRSKAMIDDTEFNEMTAELDQRERSLRSNQKKGVWYDKAAELVNLAHDLSKVIAKGTPRDKRGSLTAWGSNLVLDGQSLRVYNTKPIQAFTEMLARARKKNSRVEPQDVEDCSIQNTDFALIIPSLCGGIEIIRTSIIEDLRENSP